MPIEIRELHIKATVQEAQTATGANCQDGKAGSATGRSVQQQPEQQMDAIIAECVEQVLNILKEKQER